MSLIPLCYKRCNPLAGHYSDNEENYVQFTCDNGFYQTTASLSIPGQEGVIRHLFATNSTEFGLPSLCIFYALYFSFMVICSGIAYPQGTFVPNIMLGALNGRIIGEIINYNTGNDPVSNAGVFALIGAASQLSAWTRTIMCVVVTLTEITGNVDLILPMGLCTICARQVSMYVAHHSFAHAQCTIEHEIEPGDGTEKDDEKGLDNPERTDIEITNSNSHSQNPRDSIVSQRDTYDIDYSKSSLWTNSIWKNSLWSKAESGMTNA